MLTALLATFLTLILVPSSFATPISPQKISSQEIPVQLFGQNCLLQGPFGKETLKAIHAISPEQNPVPSQLSALSKLRDKITNQKNLPPGVEVYSEKLKAHLDAKITFLKGKETFQKNKLRAPWLKDLEAHLLPQKRSFFLKQTEQPLLQDLSRIEALTQLETVYMQSVASTPDEDFHRAIQRLNTWYNCSMEEAGEGTE